MVNNQMEIFDLEEFETNNLAVHCSTYQIAKNFLKRISELGMKWSTGESLEQINVWSRYHHNTVYYGNPNKKLTYGHLDYVDEGTRIVEAENLIFSTFKNDYTFTRIPFSIEEFKESKLAIHCDTKEKAEKFLQYLDSKGLEWCNGDSLVTHTNWEIYRDKTCYIAENGIEYCNKDYYQRHDYDVKSVDNFLFPFDTEDDEVVEISGEFPIKKFKNEMIAIHCGTHKKSQQFLSYLAKLGIKWRSGELADEEDYYFQTNQSIYYSHDECGLYFSSSAELVHSVDENIRIWEVDDFEYPDNTTKTEDETQTSSDTVEVDKGKAYGDNELVLTGNPEEPIIVRPIKNNKDFVTYNSQTTKDNYKIQLETSDRECYETVETIIRLYIDIHRLSKEKSLDK